MDPKRSTRSRSSRPTRRDLAFGLVCLLGTSVALASDRATAETDDTTSPTSPTSPASASNRQASEAPTTVTMDARQVSEAPTTVAVDTRQVSEAPNSAPVDYAAEREATLRGIERNEADWEYDPYYLFALTRNMSDSGLPMVGQVLLYPLGFAIDLVQWPLGALAGLAGK